VQSKGKLSNQMEPKEAQKIEAFKEHVRYFNSRRKLSTVTSPTQTAS